jgi:hypothetical protein
MYKKNVKSF